MELTDRQWNQYLAKYSSKYSVKKAIDGVYKIICNQSGTIELHSFRNKQLSYYREFKTPNKLCFFLKKKPSYVFIHQLGLSDINLIFLESKLPLLLDYFLVKKRMILSEAERMIRKRRCKNLNVKKNNDYFI